MPSPIQFKQELVSSNDLVVGSTQFMDKILISNLLVAIRLLIASYWKSDGTPLIKEWYQKLDLLCYWINYIAINRLKYRDFKTIERFAKI